MGGSSGGDTKGYGSMPWWVQGAHKSLINKAENFAYGDRGSYVPYGDQRIAGFTNAELTAQDARQAMYNQGDPSSEFASGLIGQAASYAPQMEGFATNRWQDADRSSYMNPYVEDVLNPQLREARESFDRDLNRSQADSIARGGSVGSYRMGLQDNQLRGQKALALSDIRGKGMYDAYGAGQSEFEQEQARGLQGLGSTAQTLQGLAGASSQLGFDSQQRQLSNISELERSGAVQREMQQREMDLAYGDFTQERDFPMQRMQFLSSILSGVPNAQLGGQTTSTPQPGLASQLASLGLGAAGISQILGLGGGA